MSEVLKEIKDVKLVRNEINHF